MTTMTETRGSARLRELFGVLSSLIVNDEKADEIERSNREASELQGRRLRRERLMRVELELERKIHAAVIESPDLKPHPKSLGERSSLRFVQRWMAREDLPPCLVLVGKHGVGKSVSAAWAVANHPGPAAWYSATDIVRHFGGFNDDDKRCQRRIRYAKLLVIDDVAFEPDSQKMCTALVEILEKRKQRRTIITTNLVQKSDPGCDSWEVRYPDDRLHSRLKESAVFVADNGPDLRGMG